MERLLKALRSLLMATALLILLALPAFAQAGADGDITISVSCETDPEEVSIANNTDDVSLMVEEVSSLVGGETFPVGEGNAVTGIEPGETLTYEFGPGADERLSGEFIFEDDDAAEGVVVGLRAVDSTLGDYTVRCVESPASFEIVSQDQQGESPDEMPDTGAGGLATGAALPWGPTGLAASGLLAAGYAVIRRR